MYKILSIANGIVATDKGNFTESQFKFGINGLVVGKTYNFEFRGDPRSGGEASRIFRFSESQSVEEIEAELDILKANQEFIAQNPPQPQP